MVPRNYRDCSLDHQSLGFALVTYMPLKLLYGTLSSTIQSIHQPIKQSINQPTNQPTNQQPTNNQPTNQPTNQSIKIDQPICLFIVLGGDWDPTDKKFSSVNLYHC